MSKLPPIPPLPENDLNSLPQWAQDYIAALHVHIKLLTENFQRQIEELQLENARLQQQLDELSARLDKNSSNSSKPPSQDPPHMPRPAKKPKSKRKRGGQPGHPGHQRTMLPPEEVDEIKELRAPTCKKCGGSLENAAPTGESVRRQTLELRVKPVVVTEYCAPELQCTCCGTHNRAAMPVQSNRVMGPRLTAVAAHFAAVGQQGRRDVQDTLKQVLGVHVSLGAISEAEKTVATALQKPHEEIHKEVLAAPVVHIDDTPFYEGLDETKARWERSPSGSLLRKARKRITRLWTVCTKQASYFRIFNSRAREVVKELLGGFTGTTCSDRLASFLHLDHDRWQVCWAHLARDFEAMAGRKKSRKLGEALSVLARNAMQIHRKYREGKSNFTQMSEKAGKLRENFETILKFGPERYGADNTARKTCSNLLKIFPALWVFASTQGVEPTNNTAERALRRGVMWRKGSHGTMSERGSRFAERMLSVTATLKTRGKNAVNYITQCLEAHLQNRPPPPLPSA